MAALHSTDSPSASQAAIPRPVPLGRELSGMAERLKRMAADLGCPGNICEEFSPPASGGESISAQEVPEGENRSGLALSENRPPEKSRAEQGGETRSVYLHAGLVAAERKLLGEYHVQSLPELVCNIYEHFHVMVTLMKNLNDERQFSGFAVQLFAESMEPHLIALQRVQSWMSELDAKA